MTELYKALDPELLADLVDSWAEAAMKKQLSGLGYAREIAKKTLEWVAPILRQQGADQELEACCQALRVRGTRMRCMEANQTIEHLRAVRRPKPPSLKEQALHELNDVYNRDKIDDSTYDTIRRAIEQLPDAL